MGALDENNISELEKEFREEGKGSGSSSPYIVGASEQVFVGYDIHPENIEALFFEGIGVPRWESIKADSVEEQEKLYMELYNGLMAKFPMLGRANDTESESGFSADEIPALLAECNHLIEASASEKAVRAAQKFAVAATKAAAENGGLVLKPRQ